MNNFNAAELARADLKSLKPYEPVVYPGVIRLDANESPFDFPPEIKDYIQRNLHPQAFNRYPDPLAEDLLAALAGYTGAPKNCILAGNGSDELILNLALTFATGGKVLIATPTFSMYEVHSRVAGAEPVSIPRKRDFSIDLDEIIKQENSTDTRLIFICSPNNPTANETTWEELETLLQNTRSLVVVDEAYVEFGGKSCLPLMEKYPNLAVLRSFSKSFGLAGLRVGYIIAHPGVIKEMKRIKQPFNLNSYSQRAALAVLEHLPLFQERIATIIEKRDNLWNQMSRIKGIDVLPTVTNFITFKTHRPAEEVYKELLDKGILIRNVSSPELENCLRVSVGTDEENNAFLKSLAEVMGQDWGVTCESKAQG